MPDKNRNLRYADFRTQAEQQAAQPQNKIYIQSKYYDQFSLETEARRQQTIHEHKQIDFKKISEEQENEQRQMHSEVTKSLYN